MQRSTGPDIARITLSVLFIGILIAACVWVLKPFLGAMVWATMIVVATWPMMLATEARLGGRRWAAVAVMTAAMLLLLVVPLTLTVVSIVENSETIVGWTKYLASFTVPSPPDWVTELPWVGPRLAVEWATLAAASREDLATKVAPYVGSAIQWVAGRTGGVGLTLLHFLLTLVITAVLYATGETAATGVRRFARRLADERGESSIVLAGQAIRAVALGIVVTAIVQSAASGIGLVVSGVPYSAVLTAVIFVLCIAQLGPLPVLVPVVCWVYWSGDVLWGTLLLVWSVLVGATDNVLRPVLIRRGADLPLLLIFVGVIGGLISLGLIGLFVGPVVLAVTHRLLESWVAETDHEEATPADAAPPHAASSAADGNSRQHAGVEDSLPKLPSRSN
jgi:predicted PurR-regulated permease PerM